MIDESMDISIIDHLVVFAIIIEEGVHVTIFLGLIEIEGGKNVIVIFDCLINHLKNMNLIYASLWHLVVVVLAPWWDLMEK